MSWTYNNKTFTQKDFDRLTKDGYIGFIYEITQISTGKKYIGKKGFFRKKTLPITKTRKRRKHTFVESDWKDYYSSSPAIMESVKNGNKKDYKREILMFGKSKGSLSYLETATQFIRNVLLDDNYLNGIINCRIHKKHLKDLESDLKIENLME